MKIYSSAFLLLIIIIEFNSKVLGSDNKIGQSASTAVATSKVSQFNDFLRQNWDIEFISKGFKLELVRFHI